MISPGAIAVADAMLYEGAFLYPYRSSSLKNRFRWTLGTLAPPDHLDHVTQRHGSDVQNAASRRTGLTAACLLHGQPASVEVLLRFLSDDGEALRTREVRASARSDIERVEFEFQGVSGSLVIERCVLGDRYQRLRACVQNHSARQGAQGAERALHGVHLLLHVAAPAHFVSMTDPPPQARTHAALCEGDGLWCTVMGSDRASPDTALAAPVILPDFPQVAPESYRDLCDATEIDELLALRIRTLSDAEKSEARAEDPWVRQLLDRVEALTDQQLLHLHGARRELTGVHSGDAHELCGARVRLRPRRSADAIDMLLSERTAIVRRVERSVDGELLLGVSLDDDPGADLGAQGMPGHRFFFGFDEVELLEDEELP